MGVEPLPYIRDGILVERLVKTMRHVAHMGRCQHVVQPPEGVRRRPRVRNGRSVAEGAVGWNGRDIQPGSFHVTVDVDDRFGKA
jgi:hypothetical protein